MNARVRYTNEQLNQFIIDDLRIDAETSEQRAALGGTDAKAQAAYAVKCRADIAKLTTGAAVQLDQYGWPVALRGDA